MSIKQSETNKEGAHACRAGSAEDSPDLVIRGKTIHTNQIAHIDWLAFTVKPDEGRDWRWLRKALEDIFNIPEKAWVGTNRKWSGYKHLVKLELPLDRGESINLGLAAYGGDSQRGTMHVSLNATACARITDWSLVHDWGITVDAVIKRADLAHDDFEGETVNINIIRKWYDDGLFNVNGRPPTGQLIDDLGSGKGKTFSIGRRGNSKYLRCYEKGKKEGDPNSPWVRVELELRDKDILILWDVLINPEYYLAGTYPCLSYLSIKQEKLKTLHKAKKINYDATVRWAKSTVGKTINAMLQVERGNKELVFDQLIREGIPKRLAPYLNIPDIENQDEYENVKP